MPGAILCSCCATLHALRRPPCIMQHSFRVFFFSEAVPSNDVVPHYNTRLPRRRSGFDSHLTQSFLLFICVCLEFSLTHKTNFLFTTKDVDTGISVK
uniref:Uncharacterized protein n=1 Tax=Rhipicephalus zambeziensis TaxID=60191 RepID=A0A224Y6J9_9ACAR